MTIQEIKNDLSIIPIWIHNCATRMTLNSFIDKEKVNPHPLYEFEEFKIAVFDTFEPKSVIKKELELINNK